MSGTLDYGPILLEGQHRGEFLVSEAEGFRSRDVALITNAGTAAILYPAGLVLALTTAPVSPNTPGVAVPYTVTQAAGTQAAILWNNTLIQPGASAKVTVVSRDAEVNASELKYDASVTTAAQQATVIGALQTAHIIPR